MDSSTKVDELLTIEDKQQNKLICDKGNVYLKLSGEQGRKRKIGTIDELEGGIRVYKKFEEEQNIMKVDNSWSIVLEVLDVADRILYETRDNLYGISVEDARKHGKIRQFEGYEKKIYVSLDHWTKSPKTNHMTGFQKAMMERLGIQWYGKLKDEVNNPYFKKLAKFISEERKHKSILPDGDHVFNAYKLTPYLDVKVVMLGQDPYPSKDHAHGLAFSSLSEKTPKSLENIQKKVDEELRGVYFPPGNNLTYWAKQGVFLLNTILTVEEGKSLSHKDIGWERFTTETIRRLNAHPKSLVFILWGNHAKSYKKLLDCRYHKVIEGVHPSPLSAHKGFFENEYFRPANLHLSSQGRKEIEW